MPAHIRYQTESKQDRMPALANRFCQILYSKWVLTRRRWTVVAWRGTLSLPKLYYESAHEGTLVELDFPCRVDELMREDREQPETARGYRPSSNIVCYVCFTPLDVAPIPVPSHDKARETQGDDEHVTPAPYRQDPQSLLSNQNLLVQIDFIGRLFLNDVTSSVSAYRTKS